MVAEEDDLLTSQGGALHLAHTTLVCLLILLIFMGCSFLAQMPCRCYASPIVAGITALIRHCRTVPGGFPALLREPQAQCFQGIAGYMPTFSPFSDGRPFSLHYVDSRKRTRLVAMAEHSFEVWPFPSDWIHVWTSTCQRGGCQKRKSEGET